MHGIGMTLTSLVAPSSTAPGIEPVRRAAALLTLIVIILGVLLLMTLLVIVSKRIRRRQAAATPRGKPATLSDPWAESARRVEPFDSRDAD